MNTANDWSNYYSSGKDFVLINGHVITKILSYVDSNLAKSCLDLGCGTGQLTRELYHRGYTCLGLDMSEKAIEIAVASTNHSGLEYRCLDFENEPGNQSLLEGKTYSLVTCKLVFAFIQNKEQFLHNVKKVTDQNGVFAIITPTYTSSKDESPIAVDYKTTLKLLEDNFSSVVEVEMPKDLNCFICKV